MLYDPITFATIFEVLQYMALGACCIAVGFVWGKEHAADKVFDAETARDIAKEQAQWEHDMNVMLDASLIEAREELRELKGEAAAKGIALTAARAAIH